ncbi:MAG: glycosyltransferase, partial [Lachnospiraceae bacterium]|nr:glycosyltransferase [Lachnospiraceae bacterium]
MIRVLHVFGKLDLGGAESRIMDIYRHLDRSRVQFDFVVHTEDKCYYEDEVNAMGGRLFRVPRFKIFNITSYKKAFRDLFADYGSEFTVVHGHMTSTASIYLPLAKEAGIRTTVAHARSAGVDPGLKGFLTRMMRKNLWKKADFLFACSEKAGISVFGQRASDNGLVKFVPNAIRVGLFAFNEQTRNETRNELGVGDKYVIGHVGRFHFSKNHEFL